MRCILFAVYLFSSQTDINVTKSATHIKAKFKVELENTLKNLMKKKQRKMM